MDNSKFSILEAVGNAYLFAGREWLYLLKAGSLPVLVQIGTSLFVQFQREDASAIEAYLWGLPATVLFAWFMFLETRLLLLGERLDCLPPGRDYFRKRQHNMKLAVIISLLFNMSMSAAITLLLLAAESGRWGTDWPLTLGGVFIIGAMLWGVRFGVLPILAAVGYPFRSFLRQTQGMMFSLRLIGMGIACLFPVAFLFQIFIVSFIGKGADMTSQIKLTAMEQTTVIAASAPFSLIIAALMNAAAVYALKQLLGGRRGDVLA